MKKFIQTFKDAGSPELEPPTRILLADDDKDDCELFSSAINDCGLSISLSFVHDGEALILGLQTCNILPDIIFLDLNMPLKNGFDALKEIKADPRLSALHVICLSTSMDKRTIEKVYEAGAIHYIRKPNSYNDLVLLIRKAINLCQQTKPPWISGAGTGSVQHL